MQTMLALLRCVTALARGQKELACSYLPQIICATELGGDHPSSVAFALNAKREQMFRGFLSLLRSNAKIELKNETILAD